MTLPLTDGAMLLGSTDPTPAGDAVAVPRELVDATVAVDRLEAVLADDICLARLAAVEATTGTGAPLMIAVPVAGRVVATAGRVILG